MAGIIAQTSEVPAPHPRQIGWLGVASLAMGGSNQSLFIMSALFIGQGAILGQGSAAVPLLMLGLLLSYMALPGWTELCCMFPNRVGGIAATCSEAFRPYSPILSNLTGVCYWWGWVPTCGYTALLAASAIQQWYFPNYAYIHCLSAPALSVVHGIPEWLLAGASTMEGVPTVPLLAAAFVLLFAWINLLGMKWISRCAVGIASVSANLLRVFNHGFTTKKDGHGFGLHASANSARQLGGSIAAHSDGPGHGATFVLKLPVKPIFIGVYS